MRERNILPLGTQYIQGVTQGFPLGMIAYGIGILLLIRNLKQAMHDVTQPWYADDAGALGTFTRIETYFDSLTHQGPGRGYYSKLSKSVPIVRLENIEAGKCSYHLTDLRCARSHIIWRFTFGTTSPNAVV